MKNKFNIFFAIPFDSLSRVTYEALRKKLIKHYEAKGYSLNIIIGNKQVGPSRIQKYLDVISFKRQNEDLQEQFYKDINEAHVVIADLTNDNPNVHVELGMAVAMKKNILRVTARKVGDVGFDIRNKQICEYKKPSALLKLITDYLDTFLMIKDLKYDVQFEGLYWHRQDIRLPLEQNQIPRGMLAFTQPIATFRDGGINIRARFLYVTDDRSWMGIAFRKTRVTADDGYYLRIYKNGKIDLAYGPDVIATKQLPAKETEDTFDVLIDILNDSIEVKVNHQSPLVAKLDLQNIGEVHLVTFEAQAEFESVKTINRDTL